MMTVLPIARKGRKFAQVVRGAAVVFLRDGFSGASVDDIAQAGQVSKATLYSYFPDKAQMFAEAMRAEAARLTEDFALAVPSDLPPDMALPRILHQLAEWLAEPERIGLYRVLVAEAAVFPDLALQFHGALHGMLHGHLRACLDGWAARGALTIDDTAAAADQLLALAGAGLPGALLLGPPQTGARAQMPAEAARAADLFLCAYAPPVPRGQRRLMQS